VLIHIQCCCTQVFDNHTCVSFCIHAASSLSRNACEACCIAQAAVKRTYTGFGCRQVEEGAVYGILSSKRHHIFVRRPADAASRHADFSDTFDSELQTAPSLRLMYLYLLKLAQNTPQLDPSLRPTTAAELKWACVNTKRKRSERVVNDPVADPGDSDDDAEDDKWDAASGNAGDKSDDADIINSEGTTGADGPSAHTRSKDVKSSVQHTSVKTRNVSRKHALYTSRADCEQLLTQLPLFARPSLDFNTIRIGKNYVVSLQPPSLFVLGNCVVFVLHWMHSKHNVGSSHCRCFLCILLAALVTQVVLYLCGAPMSSQSWFQVLSMYSSYTTYVKAKDCNSYTYIISCSHLCCVTNEHDHGALIRDKVNLSELFHVVQSPKFLSSKGYSCKLSPETNTWEAISPLTVLYKQRWLTGLPVQVVSLSGCTKSKFGPVKFYPCQPSCNFSVLLLCHFWYMVVKLGHCSLSVLACCLCFT